jgi:hypothetical protein
MGRGPGAPSRRELMPHLPKQRHSRYAPARAVIAADRWGPKRRKGLRSVGGERQAAGMVLRVAALQPQLCSFPGCAPGGRGFESRRSPLVKSPQPPRFQRQARPTLWPQLGPWHHRGINKCRCHDTQPASGIEARPFVNCALARGGLLASARVGRHKEGATSSAIPYNEPSRRRFVCRFRVSSEPNLDKKPARGRSLHESSPRGLPTRR